MDVLGVWCNDVLSEGIKRVGDHLHVARQMERSWLVGQRREELGRTELRHEGMRVAKRVPFDAPVVFAAQDFVGHVVQHVGGVGAADLCFDLAFVAVVDERFRGRNGGCCVGDLVGEHLMNVGAALECSESSDRLADHAIGEVDGISARRQVRSSNSHG